MYCILICCTCVYRLSSVSRKYDATVAYINHLQHKHLYKNMIVMSQNCVGSCNAQLRNMLVLLYSTTHIFNTT